MSLPGYQSGLTSDTAVAEAAAAFTATLADSPRVSIFQTLQQTGEDTVQKSDFTLVQNGAYTWFVAAAQEDETELLVKTTNKDEVAALLAELV